MSATSDSIEVVVRLITSIEVLRIHARWVIARVKNTRFFYGEGSASFDKAELVSEFNLLADSEPPVSFPVAKSSPDPTVVLDDFRPES